MMALADYTVPFCHFHWDIQHPFTPWRLLMARFYHASPIVTQWNVMIEPWKRRINWWTFKLHLQIEHNFDGRREIRANRVQIGIFLQNRCIDERDVANVSFWPSEFFTYAFKVNAIANVLQDQELLVVKIMLDIPGEPVGDNRYTIDNSSWLSEDLLNLFLYPVHSDLKLRLPTSCVFQVHACIFRARWNNFLTLDQSDANREVALNISEEVLRDILVYLYSGKMLFGSAKNETNYYVELFNVLTQFHNNHLVRALRFRNMEQRRVSVKNTRTVPYIFPLWELVNGRFVGTTKRWRVNENTQYDCTFTIYVQTYCSSPWLSYSLRSNSEICVYAQVNLDIRKRIAETHGNVGHAYYQTTHVHQCDYTIEPKGFEQSKNSVFLGCPETFENFYPLRSSVQVIEGSHSMLCTLTFTDGIILDRFESTTDEAEVRREAIYRQNLLGDHLFRLFSSQVEADLMINAPTENVNQPDETYWIHTPIFAARVPRWWKVFKDHQDPRVMPEETRLHLRSEALPFVLNYIYSSRSQSISPDLLDDIERFAKTGESLSLQMHIHHIRNEVDIDDWDSE